MSQVNKPEDTAHGSYERRDLTPAAILYFLLILGVGIIISLFILVGVFDYLDRREKASQPAVNPLITHIPEDTRHVTPGYPETAFPSPRLEDDERGQLNSILTREQDRLYTYGWIDQKAGTMHIPIERAMDLLVQRGLPVRPQGAGAEADTTNTLASNKANPNRSKGKKK
jgi:hypothetical protein